MQKISIEKLGEPLVNSKEEILKLRFEKSNAGLDYHLIEKQSLLDVIPREKGIQFSNFSDQENRQDFMISYDEITEIKTLTDNLKEKTNRVNIFYFIFSILLCSVIDGVISRTPFPQFGIISGIILGVISSNFSYSNRKLLCITYKEDGKEKNLLLSGKTTQEKLDQLISYNKTIRK